MLHLGWLLGRFASCSCAAGLPVTSTRNIKESATSTESETQWAPFACFQKDTDSKIALIVLNRPIDDVFPLLKVGWSRAVLRAAADGGANRLQECLPQEERKGFVPDILTGDFDSIRPDVMQYNKDQGSQVIETLDQNYTDFTKCLQIVVKMLRQKSEEVDSIMAFGAFGGRLDQTLANIHTALLAPSLTDTPLYLLGDESLALVLQPGKHRITMDTGMEAPWCGLVPIAAACQRVKTTGLKWNIENQPMSFDGLISTSNTYAPGTREVTVSTDQPLLWTMGIRPLTAERPCNGQQEGGPMDT